jgi:hypothetical protein
MKQPVLLQQFGAAVHGHHHSARFDRNDLGADQLCEALAFKRLADRGRHGGEGRFGHSQTPFDRPLWMLAAMLS